MTPLSGSHGAGRSVGITLDRELFIERGDVRIAHAGATPRDTRRIRARIFWLHDKPLSKGDQILIRLGTRESRASVVAIEKAVDPGELSNAETKAIARNHVGEIDIALAQPIAADPYSDNPRTGRLVIEVNGRIAGGGAGAVGRRRTTCHSRRHRAGGKRVAPRGTLGALPPQRRGDLADRPARLGQIDAGKGAGAPAVLRWRFADPARRRHLARRPQQRSRLFAAGPQRKHPPSGRSRDAPRAQRSHRHRRRGFAGAFGSRRGTAHRRHVLPRNPRRGTCPRSARAAIPRATTPRRAPAACRRSPGSPMTTSRRSNAS